MKVKGPITRTPIIKPKVIFSTIRDEDTHFQIVLFSEQRPSYLRDRVAALKLNDIVEIEGKMELNPFNNEPQIIIDNIYKEDANEMQVA